MLDSVENTVEGYLGNVVFPDHAAPSDNGHRRLLRWMGRTSFRTRTSSWPQAVWVSVLMVDSVQSLDFELTYRRTGSRTDSLR